MTKAANSDTVTVQTMQVACDGGDGASGHPKVYLTLDGTSHEVTCPYCSRHFVLDKDSK